MDDFKEEEYWNKAAHEFDTYYKEEKDALRRAIDKIFRKGMKERFDLTLQECRNIEGKRILDIGCGTGRMSLELAQRGARVTGIDFSQTMLDMAKAVARQSGLEDKCTFVLDDFTKHIFKEKFDISLALGLFDYTKEPEIFLRKIRELTKERFLASYPSKYAFQVPLRMIWLRSRNLPVYFYTKGQLKRLYAPLFPRYKIKNISALYYCVAYSKPTQNQM